jgi:CheY-like chemotaxis protein
MPVTLLLIDDDEVDIMAVTRALHRSDLDGPLRIARDGIEALAALRGEGVAPIARPYLVLLDLNLPRMNGLEFLQELRADPVHRTAVVFALTTSSCEEDTRAAYELGIAGYVVKWKAGNDLGPLVELLRCYRRIVELP